MVDVTAWPGAVMSQYFLPYTNAFHAKPWKWRGEPVPGPPGGRDGDRRLSFSKAGDDQFPNTNTTVSVCDNSV